MRGRALPAVRSSVDVRRTPDGRILVLRGPELGDLELETADDRLWGLLADLDGTRTVDALTRRHGSQAPAALALLEQAGVVDDLRATQRLAGEGAARFARQLAYFADALGGWQRGISAQRRLGDRHVVILGAGGLGGWCALALAAVGVGRLTIVDGDEVELSNLNRQVLFDRGHVGARKAPLAEARLRALAPELAVRGVDRRVGGPDDVAELVASSDLAVCTMDQPAHRIDEWVHLACRGERVPYLALSQHPPHGRVGPLHVAADRGCHECRRRAWARDWPRFSEVEDAEQLRPPSATYGPACALIAAMAAHEATAFLTGLHEPASRGAELLVDLRTWAVRREPVVPDPDCPACGSTSRG